MIANMIKVNVRRGLKKTEKKYMSAPESLPEKDFQEMLRKRPYLARFPESLRWKLTTLKARDDLRNE
jgi:hypothetical protein